VSGFWICGDCFEKIEFINTPICYRCGRLSDGFKVCNYCRRNSELKRVITCGHWQDPLKLLIHYFKYHKTYVLAEKLGALMAVAYFRAKIPIEDVILVPVPLHRYRLWARGFNQARELANVIGGLLNMPIKNSLIRQRNTQPQFGLRKDLRLTNVIKAFSCNAKFKHQIFGKTIVLVDDVVATGATLSQCAKELKKQGAKEVWALVLAKA